MLLSAAPAHLRLRVFFSCVPVGASTACDLLPASQAVRLRHGRHLSPPQSPTLSLRSPRLPVWWATRCLSRRPERLDTTASLLPHRQAGIDVLLDPGLNHARAVGRNIETRKPQHPHGEGVAEHAARLGAIKSILQPPIARPSQDAQNRPLLPQQPKLPAWVHFASLTQRSRLDFQQPNQGPWLPSSASPPSLTGVSSHFRHPGPPAQSASRPASRSFCPASGTQGHPSPQAPSARSSEAHNSTARQPGCFACLLWW